MHPLAKFTSLDGEFWDFAMIDDEIALEILGGMSSDFSVSCEKRKSYVINTASVYLPYPAYAQ
jgi:hypothetical protein